MLISNKKDYKDLFLKVCLGEIAFESINFINASIKKFIEFSFHHSNKCRYCNKPVTSENIEITQSYWGSSNNGVYFYPCQSKCKEKGYADEKYECQCIDAACNDCKNFECIENKKDYRLGNCRKKNIQIKTGVNAKIKYRK
jgi:hypothetical protein